MVPLLFCVLEAGISGSPVQKCRYLTLILIRHVVFGSHTNKETVARWSSAKEQVQNKALRVPGEDPGPAVCVLETHGSI